MVTLKTGLILCVALSILVLAPSAAAQCHPQCVLELLAKNTTTNDTDARGAWGPDVPDHVERALARAAR